MSEEVNLAVMQGYQANVAKYLDKSPRRIKNLGSPVVPFTFFCFWVLGSGFPYKIANPPKKGALIVI